MDVTTLLGSTRLSSVLWRGRVRMGRWHCHGAAWQCWRGCSRCPWMVGCRLSRKAWKVALGRISVVSSRTCWTRLVVEMDNILLHAVKCCRRVIFVSLWNMMVLRWVPIAGVIHLVVASNGYQCSIKHETVKRALSALDHHFHGRV